MAERLQKLLQRLSEWWDKFTSKQKTVIICAIAGVSVALVVLFTMVNQPKYATLIVCDTTKQASEIKGLLDGEKLNYKISDDGFTIQVEQSDLSNATLLLGANNYPTYGYDIEKVFEGGFSATESDKEKRYQLYLEQQLKTDLEANEHIASATVNLNIPENDGTLISQKEESYASIMLELDSEVSDDEAAGLARFVATALGNKSTETVVIMDSNGNMLFSGEDDSSISGSASNRLSYKQQYESLVKSEVRDALIQSKIYDLVQVVPNLEMDWSVWKQTEHTYTPADGQTQGVLSHEDSYNSESTGGNGGVPGTDANAENTYVIQDNAYQSSTVDEQSKDYLPNETITDKENPGGQINYGASSIGITAIHYVVHNEDELKAQGLLDGITFEEYKAAHSERVRATVEEDVYSVVSMATGIATNNITIVAYDEPLFVESEDTGIKPTDILQIVLIVLILGLLGFVVLRSMRSEKKQEEEQEELSLDTILQSTPDEELEDIEMDEKSEVRKMIEKFVDENPEAVASLLRNWLQDDWS